MTLTPTKLTLRHLNQDGWTTAIVETWNSHARIRQDLFGIIDVLALKGTETLAVQTTTYRHVSERINKIGDSPHINAIREAGWRVLVHGWAKRNGRWVLAREVDVS